MSANIFLSIVVPAYNEAASFSHGSLTKIVDFLSTQKFTSELIVVNDGSSDATSKLLHKFAEGKTSVRIIDSPHQGKAATVMRGVSESRGQYIIFSDMDQATPISESKKLISLLQSGYDIAIGSRANREGAPLFRQVLAYGMVVMRAIILRLPFKDTQCGFKGFSKKAAEKIFPIMYKIHPPLTISGAAVNPGFDVELLYLGRKMGFKIAETSVVWHHIQSNRVRFFKDALSGITELILVRWRSITNAYQL